MKISANENKVFKRKPVQEKDHVRNEDQNKPVLTEDDCFEKYGKQDYKGKSFYEKVKVAATDMCGCNGKF